MIRLESRVRVSGVAVTVSDKDLLALLTTVGPVDKCEKYESRDGQTQVSYLWKAKNSHVSTGTRIQGLSI